MKEKKKRLNIEKKKDTKKGLSRVFQATVSTFFFLCDEMPNRHWKQGRGTAL